MAMSLIIKTLLIFTIFGHSISCSTSENILDKVFNKNQLVTVSKIIDFYDNFVLSRTDKKLSINKAYLDFLNTNCPKAIESGDLSILIPDKTEKISFYKTLDRKALSEIYFIQDTVKLFDRNKKEFIDTYLPYSFTLNTQGKYAELLKLLASKNDFYKEYFETIQNCGDLCPSNYAAVLKNYQKMDFKEKEERLVLIVNLLHAQETIKE